MTDRTSRIDFSELPPIWCKGCGNYAALRSLRDALVGLELSPQRTVITSGIGCSSRLPGYLNCFGFNAIHGRSLPVALGVKLANPSLTVISVAGDGDSFGIGLGHLAHTARRNVDVTHLVLDNRVYGLTKGQTSPTTPLDTITVTHPYGSIDPPISVVRCLVSFGATFVARASALDTKQTTDLIMQAVRHKGFAVVHIVTACVTFRFGEELDFLKSQCAYLEGNDVASIEEACRLSESEAPYYLGLFFRRDGPQYEAMFHESVELAKELGYADMDSILDEFTPHRAGAEELC